MGTTNIVSVLRMVVLLLNLVIRAIEQGSDIPLVRVDEALIAVNEAHKKFTEQKEEAPDA